jgi:beta-phosphoglucomutase-like phosphatase (HAD superfamily)
VVKRAPFAVPRNAEAEFLSRPLTLIFDIDGTFSETEETHREAFNQTFAAYDLPWSWDRPMYKKLLEVTGGKERIRYYIDTFHPEGGERALPLIQEIHAAKTERYTAMIDEGAAQPRPGIKRLIHEAKAVGMPVAIATTTSLPNVESLIKSTLGRDGMDLFDAVGAGDVITNKKPAPDIFNYTLGELGIGAEDAIAFEDSVNGLRSAGAAGLRTVITPSMYTEDQDFAGAFAVISDLGEPGQPYRHVAGAGAEDGMVTPEALLRWLGR